jgi:hypothetical protein
MNNAAKDIKARLIALSVLTECFVGEEPAAPNDVVTIYDTGGGAPFSEIELFNPTIQVRTRAVKYQDAYDLQLEIMRALINPVSFEINDTKYIGVWAQSDIISIGKDANNRSVFTSNFNIERQPL